MSSQPVNPCPATAAPAPINSQEQVTFRSSVSLFSFFNSRIFKMLGTAAGLTVSVVWILPAAASQWEVTLDPVLVKSLLGAVLVGARCFWILENV